MSKRNELSRKLDFYEFLDKVAPDELVSKTTKHEYDWRLSRKLIREKNGIVHISIEMRDNKVNDPGLVGATKDEIHKVRCMAVLPDNKPFHFSEIISSSK